MTITESQIDELVKAGSLLPEGRDWAAKLCEEYASLVPGTDDAQCALFLAQSIRLGRLNIAAE